MKILFATDGDRQSDAAVDMLRHFALIEGDQMLVVTVIDMAIPMSVDVSGGYLPDTGEFEAAARENAAAILETASQKLRAVFPTAGISIDTRVLFGSPDSRIVEAAGEMHPDLIVLGSRGHNRLERIFLGSVSDSVMHHAPCSVLIVHAPAQ
ncbi:MAG: universal stress protein [Pyrinomonadaceae bacterium]